MTGFAMQSFPLINLKNSLERQAYKRISGALNAVSNTRSAIRVTLVFVEI